jgi:hypothetical protein
MKKNFWMLGLIVAMFAASCDTELDDSSIKFTPRLVVNSFVNSDDFFSVQVSQTIPMTDTAFPDFIENANVIVNDGIQDYTLSYNLGLSKYVANFKPVAGKEYKVEVSVPNFSKATGRMTLPNKLNSPKSTWKENTGFDSFGFETGTITCFIADPQNERNYYEINLYRYDDFIQEWVIMPPTTTDPFLNQNAAKTDLGGFLLDDRTFNGGNRQFEFITSFGSAGNMYKYLVEVRSLSVEYYTYLQSLANYRKTTGLFSDPTPIYSNITNGRGICAGASIQRDTIQ